MAPPRGTKRKSNEHVLAADDGSHDAPNVADQRVDAKAGSHSGPDTPRKKQKTISLAQKQALIENLQLEITDRARKLRAQYNLQAQGLRTRIEIRVNRIPMALRRAKMGDLADKYKNGQHPQQAKHAPSSSWSHSARPPPVPEKDLPSTRPNSMLSNPSHTTKSSRGPGRPPQQASDKSSTTTKEPPEEQPIIAKKKVRSNPTIKQEAGVAKNSRALSPSSANIRPLPRATPNAKALNVRPLPPPEDATERLKSPVKQMSATNLFSNWAEKARSTRTGATGHRGNPSASSTASSTTGAAKGKKAATSRTTKTATITKTQRRASGTSESSENSTSTVEKKSTAKGGAASADKTAPAASKRTGVMGSIRRGVTGTTTKKAAAAKPVPASTATGRVLRKRNN